MNKFFLIFSALFIILRLVIFSNYNYDHMGGDSDSYEELAFNKRFALNEYFQISPDKLKKIRNYKFDTFDYPYLELNQVEFWEPGYPLLLKIIYKIDHNRDIVRTLQFIFIILIIFIWIKILRKYNINKYHLLVLGIILIHPFFLANPLLLYTEVFDSLLISLIYYYTLKENKSHLNFVMWGFCIAFFTITESYNLPLSIIFIISILFKNYDIKDKIYLTLTYLIILSPVFYHNYLHTDGGVLLSTKNSNNFWISNNHLPLLNFDMNENGWPLPQDYFSNKDKYPEIREPCYVSLKKQSRCEAINAIHFAVTNPLVFIKRIFNKYLNLWSPNLFAFNIGFNEYGLGLSRLTSTYIHNFYVLMEIMIIILFFFSLSYLLSIKKNKLEKLLLIQMAYFHFVIMFGHGMVRYRIGFMVLITTIIFIAISRFKTKSLKNIYFQLLSGMCLVFIIILIIQKASKVFIL